MSICRSSQPVSQPVSRSVGQVTRLVGPEVSRQPLGLSGHLGALSPCRGRGGGAGGAGRRHPDGAAGPLGAGGGSSAPWVGAGAEARGRAGHHLASVASLGRRRDAEEEEGAEAARLGLQGIPSPLKVARGRRRDRGRVTAPARASVTGQPDREARGPRLRGRRIAPGRGGAPSSHGAGPGTGLQL